MAFASWHFEKGQDLAHDWRLQPLAEPQGLLIVDAAAPGETIIYVSSGFERLTGYSAAEMTGKSGFSLHGPETDPGVLAKIQQAQADGVEIRKRLLCYRKDGTTFWNAFSLFPIRNAAGQLIQHLSLHCDVTDQRLWELQFRQAQKMEAVGLLAAGVGHDFNSLLTVINGYSDMLLEGLPDGSGWRDMVAEIRKAGERSAELTRQLLASSSRQVLAPRWLDLNDIVRGSEYLLRRLLDVDIELITDLQEGLWGVMADPAQIEQVLMNLVVNAKDAMSGGGVLRITTTNRERPAGRQVALLVTDTGCGIPKELQSRLFEPFFTTKEQGQGTGLGLSTVYGIVTQSGGRVSVESEAGAGTTFGILLPGVDRQGQTLPVEATVRKPHAPTVLVVEDESGLRAFVTRVLGKHGYRVFEAADGEEALTFLDGHSGFIDLLLTDVVMPGANGPVVVQRALERDPHTRILYMSGYTDDAVVKRGVLREEVHFLPKPFSPAKLLEKVREVLQGPTL